MHIEWEKKRRRRESACSGNCPSNFLLPPPKSNVLNFSDADLRNEDIFIDLMKIHIQVGTHDIP